MRLSQVELLRLRSRRAVAVILLVAAALAALMVASAAYDTRPVDATERAAAEQTLADLLEESESEYSACVEDPPSVYGEGATSADCEADRPQLDWFLSRSPLDLGSEVDNRGTVVLVLLAGVGILVGATFAGADWSSGSMGNQLLFEPRRVRVWLAKALAVVLGTTLATGVVLAGFWGALVAVAAGRGISTPTEVWTDILQTSGRGLGMVAGVTLGGFALTMLLRHTVGTLGLLFAYAVVGEGLAASLPFERMSQWSMADNVLAWIHDGTEVYDESICQDATGSCTAWYTLTLGHAAAYLGVLLALAVAASLVAFRHRDVP